MVQTTSQPRRIVRTAFATGASDTYAIPFSENFGCALVQVISANAGSTFSLYGSLESAIPPTVYFLAGEAVDGTIPVHPQVTGTGAIWYTKEMNIPLFITYNIAAGLLLEATVVIKLFHDQYQALA